MPLADGSEKGEKKWKAWTDDELMMVYGLSTFLNMSETGMSRFLKDYAGRHMARGGGFQLKRRQAAEKFGEILKSKKDFETELVRFTAAKTGGVGIDLKTAGQMYPERTNNEPWTPAENELLVALSDHTRLKVTDIARVLNDVFPSREHGGSNKALTNRVRLQKEKVQQQPEEERKELPTKQWLEERLGASIDDLQLMYGSEEVERKRPWSNEEKTVLLGYQRYLDLSLDSLTRFIRHELKHGTFAKKEYLSTLLFRFKRERGSVTAEEFDAALPQVTKLSKDDIRKQYGDYDPYKDELYKAIQGDFFVGKVPERRIGILRDFYINKRTAAEIGSTEGLTEFTVKRYIQMARDTLRQHLEKERAIKLSGSLGMQARPAQESVQSQNGRGTARAFDTFEPQSRLKESVQLWGRIIDSFDEKNTGVLPVTIKTRLGSQTVALQGERKVYDVAEIVVELLPMLKTDPKTVGERKEQVRGIAYRLSREEDDVARKLYETISRNVEIEGLSILIISREDKEPVVYRNTYVHPRAMGRVITALEDMRNSSGLPK